MMKNTEDYKLKDIAHIIETVDGNMRPCWNVLCKEYGNSGYKYSLSEANAWATVHGYRLK